MARPETDERVTALGALVFLAELLMLAGLAWAGARLGNNTFESVAAALALPIVALTIWARWLAPKAPHRLRNPARLIVKLALFTVTAVLLGLSGLVVVAVVLVLVCGALVVLGERQRT